MEEVEVKALPPELLASILTTQRARRLAESGARARAAFGDRTIWHVNATAHGGGVAEMLQTLLAYGRGARIDNRWLVLDGEAEFFAITKRLHNLLHGDPGDGGPLGADERACYERVVAANVAEMLTLIGARDIVLLHDPQTAGMVDGLRATGVRVVWRCHVGRDTCNDETDEAWAFLRPYLERADAFVFSREEYVPEWVERERLVIIAPSIDPFSAKNRELDPPTVSAILTTAGLLTGADPAGPVHFERRDGSQGTVRRHTNLIADGPPPPHDARLVVQVSRWDRLKDMAGVLEGFVTMAADGRGDAHLMLVGPDVSGVTDDPEGADVLAECRALWRTVPESIRGRVHLASDPDGRRRRERHHHQRLAAPRLPGRAEEPRRGIRADRHRSDVEGAADDRQPRRRDPGPDRPRARRPVDRRSLRPRCPRRGDARLLDDRELADRLGAAGRARVHDQFLGDRHLAQYVDLFEHLSS